MNAAMRSHKGTTTLVQLGLELGWLVAAVILAISYHSALPPGFLAATALGFALLMVALNAVFGLYRRRPPLSFGEYIARQSVALAIGLPIAYLLLDNVPGGSVFQRAFLPTVAVALGGLLAVRQIWKMTIGRTLAPHRVLVLGTGPEALAVETSLGAGRHSDVELVGFYPLEKIATRSVSAGRIVSSHLSLEDTVQHFHVDEIIVAVREQRGGVLPLRALLECRLNGIVVSDLVRFYERVHGRLLVDSLKASWLIYEDGFRQSRLRALLKRAFDIAVVVALLPIAAPVMAAMAFLISLEGMPIIYRQERVGLRGKTFTLLKFRSMARDAEKDGQAAWARVNDNRVTPVGRLMRRTRIDELPQLVNVLKGDMSFIGPRPERPPFVATLTSRVPFYAVRHSVKPGLTGWAQVRYTYGGNIEESVRKLEYDLYYVKNNSLSLDLLILFKTIRVVLLGEGAR
ncbi:MAG TPA: TIGR03013 family XrtA/PEP-CTERM system glycosyltransferase [Casimicrobiaceae bacterium]|nr:TIGR03013 family XrtA/PEP-CTERM system glycosyltransferase [Casimicrobiaceae bacterium]